MILWFLQLSLPLPRVLTFSRLVLPLASPYCTLAACGSNHTLCLCTSSSPLTTESTECSKYVLCGFGANNYGQVDCTTTSTLYREPVEIAAFADKNILALFCGGDQSYALGFDTFPSFLSKPRGGLGRTFSRLLSKAATQMDASTLTAQLTEAIDSHCHSHERQSCMIENVCALLASPSLLSGR